MENKLIIVECGMTTPVGLSAPETAASTRSRTVRITEIEWRDDRFKRFMVGIVPDDGLPDLAGGLAELPLSYRESRMLRLGDIPLRTVCDALPDTIGPVPLLLGMPKLHTTVPIEGIEFLGRLSEQAEVPIDLEKSDVIVHGRSSSLDALDAASQMLEDDQCEFVIVGGIDSFIDLDILGTLDMQKRIRTERNSDGFSPGEGAAFLLLTTEDNRKKYGLRPIANLCAFSSGHETGFIYSDEPYLGEGLAETFETLFEQSDIDEEVACVYASLNGERYWAKELSVAIIRHKDRFIESYQMEHPAECFGDLGAASGTVLMGLAALGIRDGYRPSPTIVYCSSDYGERAAALISA